MIILWGYQFWLIVTVFIYFMTETINFKRELLYTAPIASAVLFAGPAFYLSELDPIVRKKLESKKHQLRHWATMYNLGLKTMPAIIGLGVAAAAAAYHQTKEKFWIYGAAALFSIVPYTFAALMPLNKRLETILAESKKVKRQDSRRRRSSEEEKEDTTEDLEVDKAREAHQGMEKWVQLHRVRGLLALGAAGLFLVARALIKK